MTDKELRAQLRSGLGNADKDADGLREKAYQVYINEVTPNGNSRMDNITTCAGPNEGHQRHIATQVDMAFQAGWSAADRIEALEQQVADLLADVPCACGYDNPTDVCMKHLPLVRALTAKLATCEKYRDAYAECDRIGTQAVRDLEVKLAKAHEKEIAVWSENYAALERKLEAARAGTKKAVEALRFYATQDVTFPGVGTVTFAGSDDNGRKARTTLAEIEGEK